MNQPQDTSFLKLLNDVEALLRCPEFETAEFDFSTRELIELLNESALNIRKEIGFPRREDLVEYLLQRIRNEEREQVIKRVVALIATMPDEVLHMAHKEARELDKPGEKGLP